MTQSYHSGTKLFAVSDLKLTIRPVSYLYGGQAFLYGLFLRVVIFDHWGDFLDGHDHWVKFLDGRDHWTNHWGENLP